MMPNFLLIGAAKSGTTSLHEYLGQHPDVFMSRPKELHFFPWENQPPDYRGPHDDGAGSAIITSVEEYRAHFAAAAGYKARGESTPAYLYFPRAAERIRYYIPDARLIAVLRHPVERAYSHYLMLQRYGWETLTLKEALAAEEGRIRDCWGHTWHYLRRGFYAAQLAPYLELFRREQLKIYLHEDFLTDSVGLAQDVFRFLEVDDTFAPDVSRRHNELRLPRHRGLNDYLSRPRPSKRLIKRLIPSGLLRPVSDGIRRLNQTQAKPAVPAELRRQLIDLYRDDIIKLQDILQRDLSHWLV
jgi:hypothetical protein